MFSVTGSVSILVIVTLLRIVVCHAPICDPSTCAVSVNDHHDPLASDHRENSMALIHSVPHDGSRSVISTPICNIFALKLPSSKKLSIMSIQNCHRFAPHSYPTPAIKRSSNDIPSSRLAN